MAKWKSEIMKELEQERQLWKGKVEELKVELKREKQYAKREADKVAPSVTLAAFQLPRTRRYTDGRQSYVEVLTRGG